MNKEVLRQLDVITQRTVDLVSKEELATKISDALKKKQPLRIKYGADPSAPDIHLGHLVGLNKLKEFQELGHTVVFIIGDFTAMIGDPSGRNRTRQPLSEDIVRQNAKTYKKQVFKVLNPEQTEIHYNSEWFKDVSCTKLLELASYATVAQLLARDDFQKRFSGNEPISLIEFLYPLIQAYDSVMINSDIELGGTDQLFNLLMGRTIQKIFNQTPQAALTLPLLEGLDGIKKMSKSLDNYIGIEESPQQMFGKLMSVPDKLLPQYLSLILRKPDEYIKKIQTPHINPRNVKDDMAKEIIALFYGKKTAEQASSEFKKVFSEKQNPHNIPLVAIPEADLKNGKIWIVALLAKAGLAESRSEARRLIKQGAVYVNDQKISNIDTEQKVSDGTIIKAGKRRFAKIKL
jgi:tyrosyl-tRNA synthetase